MVNSSSTPIGWKDGERVGSHKVAGKSYVFTKISQMASTGVIFTFTYISHKQLNPWPNSSASCVVNYTQQSACQGMKVTLALVDIWQASATSHSKSSPGNFQHQYWPGWIVINMYSYILFDIEKCVLLLCEWKPAFLKPGHIYVWLLYVTWFWKTNRDVTFGISRNTEFKYSSHCSSLVLDCSHARYTV